MGWGARLTAREQKRKRPAKRATGKLSRLLEKKKQAHALAQKRKSLDTHIYLAAAALEVGRVELVALEVSLGRERDVVRALRVLQNEHLVKIAEVVEPAVHRPLATVHLHVL